MPPNLHNIFEQLKGQLTNRDTIVDQLTIYSVGLAIVSYPDFTYQFANRMYQVITPHPEVIPLGRRIEEIWPTAESKRGKRFQQNGSRRTTWVG
jgi:hypothetical protein